MQFPSISQQDIFVDKDKIMFLWKCKGTRIAKIISKKWNKVRGITSRFQNLLYSYSNQDSGIGRGMNI